MALFQGSFYSNVLKRSTHLAVYKPYHFSLHSKIAVLLHGIADNEQSWLLQTNVCRYAEQTNTALVIPDCNRSFYINTAYGAQFFDYLNDELPQAAQSFFGLPADKDRWCVAGSSMGGYGVLKSLLHPNSSFKSGYAFSPVIDIVECYRVLPRDMAISGELEGLLGADLKVSPQDDVAHLLAAHSGEKLNLTIRCGEADFLLDKVKAFHHLLDTYEVDHHFHLDSGGHDWAYWDEAVRQMFETLYG